MSGFDVAIVGAGAAGLSLAHRLAEARFPDLGRPRVALVEAPSGPLRPVERTWCFWEHGNGRWDDILTARWDELSVISHSGRGRTSSIAPLVYKMLRSREFEEYVRTHLSRSTEQYTATVTDIQDGPGHAVVNAQRPDGSPLSLTAAWVFDSRPLSRPPRARTTLLQHFRGWFVRTRTDSFDPQRPVLMDMRTPQPLGGVSFGYLLPLTPRDALVEYTEFTREVLDDDGYDAALRHYTGSVLELGPFTVTASEQGAIPMTDARYSTRAGERHFRIGAAGGATRPSTGYTFSGIQRQAASIVRAFVQGRPPVPPVPHRRRHLAMDAVLLRALDSGRLDGSTFFARLFERNRMPDVLAFLDGNASLRAELALGTTTPMTTMLVSTAERAAMTLRSPRPSS